MTRQTSLWALLPVLATGDCSCVTLHGGNEAGDDVPVVWETDSRFLLQYMRQLQSSMSTAPDGFEYPTVSFQLGYALIGS